MPRPNLSANAKVESANPITAWWNRRKERQMNAKEEAAKMITNSAAQNQSIIIEKLRSIDFQESKLPKEVLARKDKPHHPYGELEYTARGLAQTLARDTQVIKLDISKVDAKILELTLMFKQAVEQGDERAAYAARMGLYRGIADIRNRIPHSQPELAAQFVEKNEAYLDKWVILVQMAQKADRLKQDLIREQAAYDAALEKDRTLEEAFVKRLEEDGKLAAAFRDLNDHSFTQDRSQWTVEQRQMHGEMVSRYLDQGNLVLQGSVVERTRLDLRTNVALLDTLEAAVRKLPITTDPDLMNKFQEAIDDMFRSMAESDQTADESLKTMDDIMGRIKQLDRGPGAQRAMSVATEQAQKTLKRMKERQDALIENRGESGRKILNEMGVKSEEEMEQLRQKQEEEMRQTVEDWNQNEEEELIAN